VCPDLAHYDAIIPCRIRDKEVCCLSRVRVRRCVSRSSSKQVTSLAKELNRQVSVEEVTPVLLESFRQVFGNEWCSLSKRHNLSRE
jgi:lipoate-protein ligase B